jgi:SNF family Na+-dependent transporter
MLTILVIKGALLDGSGIGVEFYIGKFDGSKLYHPEIWKDATVQVFYALSVGFNEKIFTIKSLFYDQ